MGGRQTKGEIRGCRVSVLFVAFLFIAAAGGARGEQVQGAVKENDAASLILARIDQSRVITAGQFLEQYEASVRKRFFHRRPPESELRAFKRQLLDQMIDRVLLETEAENRAISARTNRVADRVARITERYRSMDLWASSGKRLVESLQATLSGDDRIEQLRSQIESSVKLAGPDVLRRYYNDHLARFTTPSRVRVSLILRSVPPWSDKQAWQDAALELSELKRLIVQGLDFSVVARERSDDPSGKRGGDLGYIHRGMLSSEAQQVVDGLSEHEVSDPVRLLRGYALFRLEQRQPSKVNSLEAVRSRLERMWLAEQKNAAWRSFVESLRASSRVKKNAATLEALDL